MLFPRHDFLQSIFTKVNTFKNVLVTKTLFSGTNKASGFRSALYFLRVASLDTISLRSLCASYQRSLFQYKSPILFMVLIFCLTSPRARVGAAVLVVKGDISVGR